MRTLKRIGYVQNVFFFGCKILAVVLQGSVTIEDSGEKIKRLYHVVLNFTNKIYNTLARFSGFLCCFFLWHRRATANASTDIEGLSKRYSSLGDTNWL